jgi:hypothetical protein
MHTFCQHARTHAHTNTLARTRTHARMHAHTCNRTTVWSAGRGRAGAASDRRLDARLDGRGRRAAAALRHARRGGAAFPPHLQQDSAPATHAPFCPGAQLRCARARAQTNAHTYMNTHARTHEHTHAHIHTKTHTHIHTGTRTHTHTRINAHTHNHGVPVCAGARAVDCRRARARAGALNPLNPPQLGLLIGTARSRNPLKAAAAGYI